MTPDTFTQAELFNELNNIPTGWVANGFNTVHEEYPDGTESTEFIIRLQPANPDADGTPTVAFTIMPRWAENKLMRPETTPTTREHYYVRANMDNKSIPICTDRTFGSALRAAISVTDSVTRHTSTPPVERMETVAKNTA